MSDIMAGGDLNRAEVENYLDLATKGVIEEHNTSGPAEICSKLVEKVNADLPDHCPSVENYKYIVHATVQVNIMGAGSDLTGDEYVQSSLFGFCRAISSSASHCLPWDLFITPR